MKQKTYHITDFNNGSFETAIEEAAASAEYNNAGQVLLFVFEQNWDEARILKKSAHIKEKLPRAELAGVTHYDSMNLADPSEQSILSFLFFEEENSFTILHRSMEEKDDAAVAGMLREMLKSCDGLKGAGIFLSEFGRDMDSIFDLALNDAGFDNVPIFGAPGAAYFNMGGEGVSYVFDSSGAYREELMLLLFHGEKLSIKTSYNFGWTRVGRHMRATKMDGPFRLVEVDGAPAADIYYKYLGLNYSQINTMNLCEFPLAVEREGMVTARIPVAGDASGALQFSSSIREGEELCFTYGAQQRIFSQIYHDSMSFREFAPQGMLLIVCGNRLLFLKEQEEYEVEYYRQLAPELSALHGNAEIYRRGRAGGELNSALVAVAFREGAVTELPDCKYAGCLLEEALHENELIPLEYRTMSFLHAVTADLQKATARANAANEAKSGFLSRMSHEIRTPINAVLGMNEMILRESSEEAIRAYAADIRSAGNTLLSLVNDILDLSKIESGRMEIIEEDYQLSSLLHDLSQMIRFRAENKGLEFKLKLNEKLPSELHGDDVRFKQVLTNILTNAVKYTEHGSVCLAVDGRSEGDMLILECSVEDTGIGIKEEDMPKLFQAFERIEEKRNRSIEGTGLGMNITLSLLHMMGSELKVESEYGKGSRFSFSLKQGIVNSAPIGDLSQRIKELAQEESHGSGFTAPDASVLAVDDNALNLKVFCGLLKDSLMHITTAGGGEEALKLAAAEHYDIIFLDHMMPGMDGMETLARLKEMKDGPNAATPVFALTANAVAGAKESYIAAGFDGFLSKPIDYKKLEGLIISTLPEDMVHEGKAAPAAEEEKRELPPIEGLDWEYARLHLNDEELMLDALKDFKGMLRPQADKLNAAYAALSESADAYRIQVHGMKSAAAVVGITLLSGMAHSLEIAARDGDVEGIRLMHGSFIARWLAFDEKLKVLFPKKEENRTAADEARPRILARLEMLSNAMELLDLDSADECMAELAGYAYAPAAQALVDELRGAVAALDAEAAARLIKEIKESI